MQKIYRNGWFPKCFIVGILLLLIFPLVDAFSTKHMSKILIYSVTWVVLLYQIIVVFKLRVIVTEKVIRIQDGIFFFQEMKWEDISYIDNYHTSFSQSPFRRRHVYYLYSKMSGDVININSNIKNYIDLLADILERAPQARVDSTVKCLVKNHKRKTKAPPIA